MDPLPDRARSDRFLVRVALCGALVTLTGCTAEPKGALPDGPTHAEETGGPPDSGGSGSGTSTGDDTADDTGATSGGDTSGGDAGGDSGGDAGGDSGGDTGGDEGGSTVDSGPPPGASSGGSGGSDHPTSSTLTTGTTSYALLAPTGVSSAESVCFLLVYSGTEGRDQMMFNMRQVAPYFGLGDCLVAVLDGTRASAADGAGVLDAVRAAYDVDNDRTWLLSESAGTQEGLVLGLDTRQAWFAAYWANDVNTAATPARTTAELGFAPWGNAGPGGNLPDATAIVDGMRAAGYQLPADAPYSGSGSTTHGSSDQFLAAVSFFSDKRRQ